MRGKRKRSSHSGIARLFGAVLMLVFVLLSVSVFSNPPKPVPSSAPEPSPSAAVFAASPTSSLTPSPEPAKEPSDEYFTIAMMGDCTLGSGHYDKTSSRSYENVVGDDYAYPFGGARELYEDADFTIVNLECAVTDHNVPEIKTFAFRAKPEYVNILTEGGVDFVTLGNNHSMDYGNTGYEDTKTNLESAGIAYAANGEWSLYTTDTGLVIGVYSKNLATTSQIREAVGAMKEAGAELIIVALHWGDEGSYRATGTQKTLGQAAIDAGAHIVMGTHPHTLQEMEEYGGGYIYYSLGNWTFGGNYDPRDKDTVLAKLTVRREPDGTVSVTDCENIPCSVSSSTDRNDYRPMPYEAGSDAYLRVLSKLDGTFTGANLNVNYEPAETGEPAVNTDSPAVPDDPIGEPGPPVGEF